MHEYGLDSYVKIQYDWDDHGKDSDIQYVPHVNVPKGFLISWYKIKYGLMSLIEKIFVFPKISFPNLVSTWYYGYRFRHIPLLKIICSFYVKGMKVGLKTLV